MSLFVLTNLDLYKALAERGEGVVGRVVSLNGKGVTESGKKWFQFKVAFKKYAETKSDKCKQDYYLVKAWADNAEQCEKLLRKGCIVKFAGEFMKGSVTTPDGERDIGEIKLIKLLDVRYPEKTTKDKEEK